MTQTLYITPPLIPAPWALLHPSTTFPLRTPSHLLPATIHPLRATRPRHLFPHRDDPSQHRASHLESVIRFPGTIPPAAPLPTSLPGPGLFLPATAPSLQLGYR